MNIRTRVRLQHLKRRARKNYFRIMKPIGTWLDKRIDRRTQNFRNNLSYDEATDMIAKAFVKRWVKRSSTSNPTYFFPIASDWSQEEFGYDQPFNSLEFSMRYLKHWKAKQAWITFNRKVYLNEDVLAKLDAMKGVTVTSEVEDFSHMFYDPSPYKPTDYERTVYIKLDGPS